MDAETLERRLTALEKAQQRQANAEPPKEWSDKADMRIHAAGKAFAQEILAEYRRLTHEINEL